jgi:hypothetical protein
MNALTNSIALLLFITATAIAAYLFVAPSDEAFDAARPQPQDATSSQPLDGICKRDEERLARLRTNPSLDEGFSFVGEIRCLRLWPQLQAIMDSLSSPSTPTATSRVNGPGSERIAASDVVSAPATTSAALDDGCKHDEDRLAELRTNPTIAAAVRFDSELKCPRLQPQLPAILRQLSKTASVEAANQQAPAPDTMSTKAAAPKASLPAASEVMSATSNDACKRDEERLAELQAKPARDDAVRFEDELKCSRLQPQVLALLDSVSQPPHSATATPNGTPTGTTSAREGTRPASEPMPETKSAEGAPSPDVAPPNTTTAGDTAPPASEPPTAEAKSAAGAPRPDGAPADTAFAGAVAPRTSEPPVSEETPGAGALSLSEAPRNTASAGAGTFSEATTPPSLTPAREVTSTTSNKACKQDEERLARLRTNPSSEGARRFAQELRCEMLRPGLLALKDELAKPSPTQTGSVSSEAPGARNAVNDDQPPSQAIADAERRIAALESDKEALAAEVSKLQHDREAPSADQATPTPSPQPAIPAEQSEAEVASQAAADAARRIAELESEKVALAAEVSKLQRDREASSAEQADPIPPPPPALAERSNAESAAALASLPEGMPARVLIRYLKNNADARAQAEKFASALATQGVEVTDVRESRSANRTEISFSYAPDETIARQVGRVVGVAPVRRLQSKDGLMVRPGTVELNLSGDSHLAVIKTTSTRESNHE